jgi:hypothetical protein
VCTCTGRTQNCTQDGVLKSTTVNSPSCALQASCTYNPDASGKYIVFQVIAINALATTTYTDRDTGNYITQTFTKAVTMVGTSTATTTLNAKVTDAFDGATANATCSAPATTVVTQTASTTGTANIAGFKARIPVVSKGTKCEYNWSVTGVDRCTITVNDQPVSMVPPGLSGPLFTETLDGLNQNAKITCVKDAVGTSSAKTVATTTLCQVLPQVIER